MKYLLLLYSRPDDWEAKSEAEMSLVMSEHAKLLDELRAAGKYLDSNALEWASSATTLRTRQGRRLVTDGPFAESREQLGGYYLVDARDLDDAMAIAARIPDACAGAVEIRPVKDVGLQPGGGPPSLACGSLRVGRLPSRPPGPETGR
jgi:hypothetical protein